MKRLTRGHKHTAAGPGGSSPRPWTIIFSRFVFNGFFAVGILSGSGLNLHGAATFLLVNPDLGFSLLQLLLLLCCEVLGILDSLVLGRPFEKVLTLGDLLLGAGLSLTNLRGQPLFVKSFFSNLLDPIHNLHGLDGLDHEVPVVPHWRVPLLLEVKGGIQLHLLSVGPPVCLGPFRSLRVMLHLEVAVAFRSAEAEDLTIVADEHHSMTWVDVAGAVPAFLNPHR